MASSSVGNELGSNAPSKPRLSVGERLVVTGIVLLSIAGEVAVIGSSFHLSTNTAYEEAIAAHAGRAQWWLLAAPFCAWATLRGGRRAWLAVAVWISLLVVAMPWWFPARDGSGSQRPLWHTQGSTILWLLVGAGLGVTLYAAWRSEAPSVRWGAVAVVGLVVVGCGWTFQHLNSKDAEFSSYLRCVPLSDGPDELAVLRRDPLWRSLPATRDFLDHERVACRARSGGAGETALSRTVAPADDRAVFVEGVTQAEAAGWRLTGTFCTSRPESWTWQATFSKDTVVGNVELGISAGLPLYDNGVSVRMRAGPPIGAPSLRHGRCWTNPMAD